MKKIVLSFVLGLVCVGLSIAQQAKVLTLREQAVVQDRWLKERCQSLLPELMRKEGIDMWLVIAREYNEDPVLRTMLPATWLSARRTTMLLIYDPGKDNPWSFWPALATMWARYSKKPGTRIKSPTNGNAWPNW